MRLTLAAAVATLMFASAAIAAPDYPGWTHIGDFGADNIYMRRHDAGPEGHVRVEFRYEIDPSTQDPGFRSAVEVLDVDCAGNRTRRVRGATYPLPQLGGQGSDAGAQPDWHTPQADTLGSSLVQAACNDTRLPAA